MYKFVLDSDALIKLTKSGIIEVVCSYFDCIITDEIKLECVYEGKKGFHKDASRIEDIINKNLLRICSPVKPAKMLGNFGKGETSAVSLYFQGKGYAIVTDDAAFIKYLEENKIRFIVPAALIILLRKAKKIKITEALAYLEKLKEFIREEVYIDAKNTIMEAEK